LADGAGRGSREAGEEGVAGAEERVRSLLGGDWRKMTTKLPPGEERSLAGED